MDRYRFNVRPLKHAFFFERKADLLDRAIGHASSQWGGIYHLMVPLESSGVPHEQWLHLLRVHDPDRFVFCDPVEADCGDAVRKLTAWLEIRLHGSATGVRLLSQLERLDNTCPVESVLGDEEAKRRPRTFSLRSGDRTLLLAALGPCAEYSDALAPGACEPPEAIDVNSKRFLEAQLDSRPWASPLNLTAHGYGAYETADFFGSPAYSLFVGSDLNTVASFWAYRATLEEASIQGRHLGRRIILIPDAPDAMAEMLKGAFELIRPRMPSPGFATNLHVNVLTFSESLRATIGGVLDSLQLVERFLEGRVQISSSWSMDPKPPETFEAKPLKWSFSYPSMPTGYLVGAGRRSPELLDASCAGPKELLCVPPTRYVNRYGGTVALDIQGDAIARLPRSPRVGSLVAEGGRFTKHGLTINEAIGEAPKYIRFKIPDEWSALSACFADAGQEVARASVYSHSTAVLRLLGGLDGLGVMATAEAFDMVEAMALKPSKKLAQRLLASRPDLEQHEGEVRRDVVDLAANTERAKVPRSLQSLAGTLRLSESRVLGVLGDLIERKVVHRGWYLTCPECATPAWHPLSTVNETITCSGCLGSWNLPHHGPGGRELPWEYSLNSLVNRLQDQDGILPLVALYRLARGKGAGCPAAAVQLIDKGCVVGDLDFVFTVDGVLRAGECKTGPELGEKDFATARAAEKCRVGHFYFCTAAVSWSADSLEKIERLQQDLKEADSRMRVEVLDRGTLLPSIASI